MNFIIEFTTDIQILYRQILLFSGFFVRFVRHFTLIGIFVQLSRVYKPPGEILQYPITMPRLR